MLIAQADSASVSALNGDETNPNDVGPVFIKRTRNWKGLVNWTLLTNYSLGLSEWWVRLLYLYSQVWTAGEDYVVMSLFGRKMSSLNGWELCGGNIRICSLLFLPLSSLDIHSNLLPRTFH